MRRFVGVVIALLALAAAPVHAVAAAASTDPPQACSGSACIDFNGFAGPQTDGTIGVGYDGEVHGGPVEHAVLTAVQDDGVIVDPSSVTVYGADGAEVSVSDNVLTIDLTAGGALGRDVAGFRVRFSARPSASVGATAHAHASVEFRRTADDPSATATSGDLSAYVAPELEVSQLHTRDPNNFGTDHLPHGYQSLASVVLQNHGVTATPDGTPLRITFGAGATLGADGVRYGVTDGGSGTRLTCTGGGVAFACPLPSLTGAGNSEIYIGVAVSDDAPIDSAVQITTSADPAGDADPSDNSVSTTVFVRGVSALGTVLDLDRHLVVGTPVEGTATFRNDGPQDATSVTVEVVDRDDGMRVELRQPDGTYRTLPEIAVFRHIVVAAGGSLTLQLRVTALRAIGNSVFSVSAFPGGTFDPLCNPEGNSACSVDRSLSIDTAAAPGGASQSGPKGPSSPPVSAPPVLAESGVASTRLLALAVLLLLVGAVALCVGTRRRRAA